METLNTSRLADLKSWLESLPHPCHDVKPVKVRIGRQEWIGCEYKQDCEGVHPGAFTHAPHTIHAFYLLGNLRKSYLHSSRECYPWEGTDWYVAGYTPLPDRDRRTEEQKAQFAPFGANFYLYPWKVPTGDSIDKHERNPHRRLPMTVEYLTSA